MRDGPRRGDDRSLLGVLDVMHGFLMIVSAQHKINMHVGKGAENALRILQPVTLRQLALDRVVMHDDHTGVSGTRTLELASRPLDLHAREMTDDRDVANVPRERVVGNAL